MLHKPRVLQSPRGFFLPCLYILPCQPQQKKRNEPPFPSRKIARLRFSFYRYYQPVHVVQVGTSVLCISCWTILDREHYKLGYIRCQVLISCVQEGIAMHSRFMDTADDERVQPIKVSLVALLVAFVIEMRAFLLRPAHRVWARGENGEYPEGARTN